MMPPASVEVDPWDAARRWPWHVARFAKGAPEVACELRLEGDRNDDGELTEDERLLAVINDVPKDCSDGLVPGWPWRAVDAITFRTKLEQARWARHYDPESPINNPTRRIDPDKIPIPFS